MKTTELRIGNLVSLENGHVIKVFEISVNWINGTGGISNEDRKDSDIFPIPLTEDILIKAGFETKTYSEDRRLFNYWSKADASIWVDPGSELFHYKLSNDREKHICYVHELQNLHFALRGEELNIEL